MIIANRYKDLVSSYLERSHPWRDNGEYKTPKLYGLPVVFSPEASEAPRWAIINFSLETEPGIPLRYPYFRLFE